MTPEEIERAYDLEFKRMVEGLYGADPPPEDPDGPSVLGESEEEEFSPEKEESCSRGCIVCLAGGCVYWV